MLYSKWLDQNLGVRIQNKSPPTIVSLAFLGFGGNLSQLFFVKNPSILLRPDKYNNCISHKSNPCFWYLDDLAI